MDTIREHMEVYGSDGELIGKVDHLEGSNEIKLTKDGFGGSHHFIPTSWVDHVDKHVHLSLPMDKVTAGWRQE